MEDDKDDQVTSPVRSVLGGNVAKFMKARSSLDSNTKLSHKTEIAVSTISRIINGKTGATIDMVDRLAQAFGLEPWQLLVPNLDPKNPQILRSSSPEEDALYRKLREVIVHDTAQRAGKDSGLGELR